MRLGVLSVLFVLAGCGAPVSSPPPAPPLPPPPKREEAFVLRFRGLPPDLVPVLKARPGFKAEELPGGVIQLLWNPRHPDGKESTDNSEWLAYESLLSQCLVIRGKAGKTHPTRALSGNGSYSGGLTFVDAKCWLNGIINFDSETTGHNEIMFVSGVIGPTFEEIRHDMLRHFVGTNLTVEQCGDGHVLVSRAGRGTMVTWPVNDNVYVHIDNVFDKDMVTAYVHRLGSILPKDFKVDPDAWVRDEIRYRTIRIDHDIKSIGWDLQELDGGWRDTTTVFPEVWKMKNGSLLDQKARTPEEFHALFLWLRRWLWANSGDFRYDDATRGFVLKGPDRYDPEHPPELPEEMRGLPPADYVPPKPAEPEKRPQGSP